MSNIVTVDFYGKDLDTFKYNGEPYVAMKSIVEGMGLSWGSQYNKLTSLEYQERFNCIVINMVAKDGKIHVVLAMPLKKLNGWLFSINANKVRADLKATIEFYQEESSNVLYEYWHKGMVVAEDLLNNPDFMIATFEKLKQEQQEKAVLEAKNKQLEQKVEEQKPKVILADSLLVSKDTILIRLMG